MRKFVILLSALATFAAVYAKAAPAQTKQSGCDACVNVRVTVHKPTRTVNHLPVVHRKTAKRTLSCIGCVGVNLYTSTASTQSQVPWVPQPPPDTDCTPHQGVDDAIDEVRSEGGSDYWVIGVRCNDGKEFIYEKVYIGPSPNPVPYLFDFADYSDSGTGDSSDGGDQMSYQSADSGSSQECTPGDWGGPC